MAIVRIPQEQRTLSDEPAITAYLAGRGIDFERWTPSAQVPQGATADDILAAYDDKIAALKQRGGYVTADVIDVTAATPGLGAMLAKFNSEHWHDEDEVRFILRGRGVFHIHPQGAPVMAIEVVPGDLLRVPRGTHHWFDLCSERDIRAIRLFQDVSGWTPRYTDTGVDARYEPVCLGPSYIPARA
jgi:1,2-dihydroxy-3-keto-5-methylthiopentene dioxygenase